MFQKALKSKNEPQRDTIGHDKKMNKIKKFKENYENFPKGNSMKPKTPNPVKGKEPSALIEIQKSKISRRRDLQRGKVSDELVRSPQSKSNQRKGLSKPFAKLIEVKLFPLLIPPCPSKTDCDLNADDSNRPSKDSEFKIKQQSKTSFKLPAEEVERLSSNYSRLREVVVERPSKGSHTQIKQESKATFQLIEEGVNAPFLVCRHYMEQSSKTSFKLPTQEASQNTSTVSFNPPTEELHKTLNPKLIQVPILRGNDRTPSTTAGKQLPLHKGPKAIKSEPRYNSSKTIGKTASEGKLQSSVEVDKRKHLLSKTTSVLSLKSPLRSLKAGKPSQIQPRQTLFQSTSKTAVCKSFQDQRKSQSQLRHRVATSIDLQKISSKIQRKSKKGNLKESEKISNLPAATSSNSPQQEIIEDDSNLPEELQLMRFVKKLKLLLKVLKLLKEPQENRFYEETGSSLLDSDVEPGKNPLDLETKSLENREAIEDCKPQFKQMVEENLEPKPNKSTELQKEVNTFSRYIRKRSNPYSEDGVNPVAKRFKSLLAEVSSGTSSEGYIEWKSKIWNEYQAAQRDEPGVHEASETESSSSLDENLQNVAILEWPTSFEDASTHSISVPQSLEIEMLNFSFGQESPPIPHALTEERRENLGKFVNPLTGEVLITPSASTSSLSTELSTTGDEDREEDDSDILLGQSINLKDLYLDESLFHAWDELHDKIQDDVMRPTSQSEEHRALSLFIEQSRKLQLKKPDEMPLNWNLPKAPTIKEMLPQIVYEFLDSLVTRCVLKVENSGEIVGKSLCKRKLLGRLHTLLCERDVERKLNNRLNLRAVNYLRRRDKLSLITEKSPRLETGSRERYYQASEKLDKLLMRLEEAREFCKQKVKVESDLCAEWVVRSSAAIEELEQFIRTSVIRDQYQGKFPQSIESQLQKMAKARKEISESRYKLIQLQHLHCKLTLHSTNIQTIGNDLCINNFEGLYSQIQTLTKQNQEQEAKNERLRERCANYIEKVSHTREQISMTRSSNQAHRTALDNLYAAVRCQRQKICAMKSQHNKIRQMVSDLKWRGGIMDKPLLMLDYDETVKRIQELRGEIGSWKQQFNILEPQVKALEEKCFRVAHK